MKFSELNKNKFYTRKAWNTKYVISYNNYNSTWKYLTGGFVENRVKDNDDFIECCSNGQAITPEPRENAQVTVGNFASCVFVDNELKATGNPYTFNAGSNKYSEGQFLVVETQNGPNIVKFIEHITSTSLPILSMKNVIGRMCLNIENDSLINDIVKGITNDKL